jgi:uncharacterized membrane protein
MKQDFARWQTYFYTGLVVMLPAVIAITIVAWLFGAISSITDRLLFFLQWLPAGGEEWVYKVDSNGNLLQPLQVKWWWSLAALMITVFIIGLIGRMTRYYIGKKILELIDWFILRVPLLNRIYAAVKQVNEALTKKGESSFKQVVLVEFPGQGTHSIGFLTGESHSEISGKLEQEMVSVFVSTTPNPTSGFLVFLPKDKVRKLEMSVADGVKYIISLGAVAPAYTGPDGRQAPALSPEQVRELDTDSGVETREMMFEKKLTPDEESTSGS